MSVTLLLGAEKMSEMKIMSSQQLGPKRTNPSNFLDSVEDTTQQEPRNDPSNQPVLLG